MDKKQTDALASAINADGNYAAGADGESLVISSATNDSISFTLLPATAYTATLTADTTIAKATTARLAGTPVEGEVWSVELIAGGPTLAFKHRVERGQSRATIAAGLAALINAHPPAADYTAVADGRELAIFNRVGNTFAAV